MNMKIMIPPPAELADIMVERTTVLQRMRRCGLDLEWIKEFTLSQILVCCDNLDRRLNGKPVYIKAFQQEMIRDPAFIHCYEQILSCLPEEPPLSSNTLPAEYGRYYSSRSKQISERQALLNQFGNLLKQCREATEDIAAYPVDDLMETLRLDPRDTELMMVYLKHFAPLELTAELRESAVSHLRNCVDVPLSLSDEQRDLLLRPFAGTRTLFSSAPFEQVWSLLSANAFLMEIALLLHEKMWLRIWTYQIISHLLTTQLNTTAS